MSCYGYEKDTTPNLSQLLETQGVIFENAFSAASWTLPSAASILTGVLPSRHSRFRSLRGPWPNKVKQVASLLSSFGIYTEAITANNYFVTEKYGFAEGFNKFTSVLTFMDYPRLQRILHVIKTWYRDGMHQGGPEVVKLFQESVPSHSHQGAFYYLHFNDTHGSFNVPRSFIEKVNNRRVGLPELLRLQGDQEKREAAICRYDGAILFADQLLTELIDFLRSIDLWNDTVLILTADHGEAFGEYKDFRGHGTHLCKSLIHIPLILLGPRILPEARRVSQVVQTIDIVPTILELCGLGWYPPSEPGLWGISLIETLQNPSPVGHRLAFSEEWGAGPGSDQPDRWLRSVTDGQYQVIWEPGCEPEVYDLSSGNIGLSNLWNESASKKVRFLLSELVRLGRVGEGTGTEDVEETEILRRLRDLGYEQ